jgi:cephalosporin-C deacetylase-like acetyl esterase
VTVRDRSSRQPETIDLRRAVDLLIARPDVDQRRLAYVGINYGAAMGGLLAGVEDRIKAYDAPMVCQARL